MICCDCFIYEESKLQGRSICRALQSEGYAWMLFDWKMKVLMCKSSICRTYVELEIINKYNENDYNYVYIYVN